MPFVPKRMRLSPIALFCSYSHRDRSFLFQLQTHLALMKREKLVEVWTDHLITPGSHIDDTIRTALDAAHLILLLVSPDFIASEYCYGVEMKGAMRKHRQGLCRVIPIIVRSVDWRTAPFGKLKALPLDGKPVSTWPLSDDAWLDVANGVRAAAMSFIDSRNS